MKLEMMMRDSRKEGREEEREEGIKKLIHIIRDLGISKPTACEQLIQKYALNENEANEKIEMYWGD